MSSYHFTICPHSPITSKLVCVNLQESFQESLVLEHLHLHACIARFDHLGAATTNWKPIADISVYADSANLF